MNTIRARLDLSLYLVLDPGLCRSLSAIDTVLAAIKGGISLVQLRDKTADTAGLIETGQALKDAMAATGVPLIINDDLEAARAVDADGVHVGQDDRRAAEVRQQLGPDKLIGLSVESARHMAAVDPTVVDYVGIGPVLATTTKTDHKPPIGFDGLARLVRMSPVPTVAIGGLGATQAAAVRSASADGVAVVSAICGQPDPTAAASTLVEAFRSGQPG